MKNNSPQDFNCEFAPETIDFIYGEMSVERRSAFRIHLKECAGCATEIRDFSDIRFSIQDWKTAGFDKIAAPKIEIPYERLKPEIVISNEKNSRLDSIRNYFRFSPVLSGATAFAVAAFLLGFVFFALRNSEEKNLVAETSIKTDLSPSPTAAGKDYESNESTGKKIILPDEDQPLIESGEKKVGRQNPVKAGSRTRGDQKTQPVGTIERKSPVVDDGIDAKNQKAVRTTRKPRLTELPDDDDDDGLRLSDMFAELDTRE